MPSSGAACCWITYIRNTRISMIRITREDALNYHQLNGKPGKIAVLPTKPLNNQRDLSLAYTPGVAYPVLEIEKDPEMAYEYTSKGNLVAVISNGTAILGLGDRGALASKPVMEGKGVLFKRFADIDVFDIEINSHDPETMHPGGICHRAHLWRHQPGRYPLARVLSHRTHPASHARYPGVPRRPARYRHHPGGGPAQRARADQPQAG
jgi:malic enzyme